MPLIRLNIDAVELVGDFLEGQPMHKREYRPAIDFKHVHGGAQLVYA
jgi:hypothetical protein